MSNRLVCKHQNLSLGGHLLVAAPHWNNEIFAQAVCLIVHHSSQGAVGLMLNRGLEADTAALWDHLGGEQLTQGEKGFEREMVHFGGPDSGPVIAMHNCHQHAEFETAGVYFAAQVQNLKALMNTAKSDCAVKIIVGQADWKPGDLDKEFAAGCWLPLPVSPDIVFADPDHMWALAIKEVGNRLVTSLTGAIPTPHILAN